MYELTDQEKREITAKVLAMPPMQPDALARLALVLANARQMGRQADNDRNAAGQDVDD